MEEEFERFFNVTWKEVLQYPETFTFEFYQGRFILHPNKRSIIDLIDLIKNNSEIKSILLKSVSELLRKYIPSASNVVFKTDGFNLIIEYQLTELQTVIPPKEYLQVYANLASNLNEEQLDTFCGFNEEFRSVCKDPIFWITVFKERYPSKYKETKMIYDWEKIYRGALHFEEQGEYIKLTPLSKGDKSVRFEAFYLPKAAVENINQYRKYWKEFIEDRKS